MNKVLIALGLAASVALVGCNKQKAPETGATTGEHLENAANQANETVKIDTNLINLLGLPIGFPTKYTIDSRVRIKYKPIDLPELVAKRKYFSISILNEKKRE